MIHELKTWPEFFDAVDRGEKTFEVRLDDRGFQVGDTLRLQRFRPGHSSQWGANRYVDRDDGNHSPYFDEALNAEIRVLVTYKLPGGRFGIDPAFCVLGFRKIEGAKP